MEFSMAPEERLIHYKTFESLDAQPTEDAWDLVREIKNMLNIYEPLTSFPLQLAPLDAQERKRGLLEEFERKEHILKIKGKKAQNPVNIIVDKKRFEEFYKRTRIQHEKKSKPQPTDTVTFNGKLCILGYGDRLYKPQRRGGRAQILTKLWKQREIRDSASNIKRHGSITAIDELSAITGFHGESSIRDAIQDIRDEIKKLQAPIEIIAQGGFQLVVREN